MQHKLCNTYVTRLCARTERNYYFPNIGPTKTPTTKPTMRAAIAYICIVLAELLAAARSSSRPETELSRLATSASRAFNELSSALCARAQS